MLAFNGYADQYKSDPITVPVGRPIRIYVLDAGPSKWSAFHVIGDLFDTVDEEGVVSHGAQTVNLSPAEGARVDLAIPQAGNYTFVTHAFGDMVKGAAGVLHTPGAPAVTDPGPAPSGGSTHPVLPPVHTAGPSTQSTAPASTITATMGEMFIHSSTTTGKAGKVTFKVTNTGAMDHWFAIMRSPVAMNGGTLDPAAVLAKTAELAPGQKDTISVSLAPGSYELVCLMPGHYSAGQHEAFTVAG